MSQINGRKILDDLRTLVADAEDLVRDTASDTGTRVTALRASLSEKISAVKKFLNREARNDSAADDAIHEVGECAWRDGEWRPVLIAVGIGVLIGLLLRRE